MLGRRESVISINSDISERGLGYCYATGYPFPPQNTSMGGGGIPPTSNDQTDRFIFRQNRILISASKSSKAFTKREAKLAFHRN